ncbi:AAA-type ATPase, N-terminal domain containing protein [Trema orientale]|uniref:AAA-type ATPase, N-terminal domain containing protein n=1 Tax=Trema orientale TaxID=63057 RepID=A0A2P5ARX0_TREOI|nr:AAA-type ATPase, N-terminal domain containing protein [Trema orientale]
MANAKAIVSTAASVAASAMLIRSIVNELLPWQLQNFLSSSVKSLSRHFSSEITINIEEFQGFSMNQVFEAAEIYLGSISNSSAQRLRVGKGENDNKLAVRIDRNEEVFDIFQDVRLEWRLTTTMVPQPSSTNENQREKFGDLNSSLRSEVRSFLLTFHEKHKEKVFNLYLPYILERSKAIKEERRAIKLHRFAPDGLYFREVYLNHPMTFDTLAIDLKLKKTLLQDLDNFMNGKEYYKRVGKAWKRGYLLYGPPGTRKSSLIVTMANHLNFDIYDLDLTAIHNNG